MVMPQKEFEILLKEFRNAVLGFQKIKLRQEIFAARQKEDRILIWKNQAASMPTVELAFVQFHDDAKTVKRQNLESPDDTCYRMVRFTITEGGFIPLKDVYRAEYVSPEAFVAEYEEVHSLNLIDISDKEEALKFVQIGMFPGFKWFWDIVNAPRDFKIKHEEHLITFFYVDGKTTVEEAMAEYNKRASAGEYDYSDMEMEDSSDEPVSATPYENEDTAAC